MSSSRNSELYIASISSSLYQTFKRAIGVALDIGVEHLFQLAERQLAHMLQAQHQLLRLLLADHGQRALGDILAEIADALEVGGDAERRHDLAEVVGHRLAPGDHDDGLLLDLVLELVDRLVLLDGDVGEVRIAALERVDRLAEDLLGETAHLGDLVVERGKLVLIGPDDVLVRVHLWSFSSNARAASTGRSSRTGR